MDMLFVWALHPKHQAHQVNGNGPWHATIAVTEVGMLIKLDEGSWSECSSSAVKQNHYQVHWRSGCLAEHILNSKVRL